MKKDKNTKIINLVFVILAALGFTFYCFELVSLHYNQTLYVETGTYESDLFAHIQMALDGWGYSIMAIVFRILSILPPFGFHFAIAAILCACEAATIAVTFVFVRKNNVETKAAIVLTAMSGFVMPMYIRAVQPYRYIGYQSASIWHNSTYIVMKLLALLCVILYLLISQNYMQQIKIWQVIVFSILLALTTSVKTNFILVFAPVALVFLIFDWIRGVPLKRILICAATVIPSILVILFQEIVLFGKSTGNGIIVDPLYSVYLRAEKPYLTMILSAAFPVSVLFYNFIPVIKDTIKELKEKKEKLTHRHFILAWAMWFVGFAELILLREVGERELDDNFAWGYDFCLFVLFVVSIVYFANNIKAIIYKIMQDNASSKSVKKKNKKDKSEDDEMSIISDSFLLEGKGSVPVAIAYQSIIGLMLLYHTYCGVYFFVKLTQGMTFFMQ